MRATRVTPILNVSNLNESISWFEKLGWKKNWVWDPPDFGSVSSGGIEIFLALNCQSALSELMGENDFIHGLKQTRTQFCMHDESTIENLFSNLILRHSLVHFVIVVRDYFCSTA